MPLVDAKCTNCGATLKVNDSQKTAFCSYCGSSFIVEQAVQNYYVNNVISAENVYVQNKGEDKKERLLKNAKTNEKFKEYSKASQIYTQLTEEYPNEYRGWLGLASLLTDNFNNVDIDCKEYETLTSYMNKALICVPSDQKAKISSQWEDYKNGRNAFISCQQSKLQNLQETKDNLDKSIKALETKKSGFHNKSYKSRKKSRVGKGGRIPLLVWSIILTVAGIILYKLYFRLFWVVLLIGIILFIILLGICIAQKHYKSKEISFDNKEEKVREELNKLYQNKREVVNEIEHINSLT